MGYIFYRTVTMILNAMQSVIFIYCILSWIVPQSRIFELLSYLLEPFVRPFRPLGQWIMEKTGVPLDFSMMFLILAIYIAQNLITRVYIAVL